MFKHILVPTDGSPLSLRAAKAAVRFASANGARITAFCVTPQFRPDISGDYFPPGFVSLPEFTKQIKKIADKYLGKVKQLADAANVPCAADRQRKHQGAHPLQASGPGLSLARRAPDCCIGPAYLSLS